MLTKLVVALALVPVTPADAPRFEDVTSSAGLEVFSPTFGAVFSDVDNDGDDDLVVSNHGRGVALYLQTAPAKFRDATDLFPDLRGDLHGIALADLDNDGDQDLVIACGGDDGVGPGYAAKALKNLLIERGDLAFEEVSESWGLAETAGHRSRVFLQTTNDDGTRIDLYLTGKVRADAPNRFYRNVSDGGAIHFEIKPDPLLDQVYNSEGRETFFDFDRDGDRDLLFLHAESILLMEKTPEGFKRFETALDDVALVNSAAVGDLDNDGDLDVFVGTRGAHGRPDRVSHDDARIHFFVRQQDDDASDGLRFDTTAPRIYIDFNVKPGLRPNDTTTIFLGAAKTHPESRRGRIAMGRASGAPTIDASGTYIWHDSASGAWHVVWRHGQDGLDERGSIAASGMTGVSTSDLEAWPVEETADRIFVNDGKGGFERLEGFELKHASATVAASLVDVDNDGDLDVVGLRANAPGDFNGEPFLVINEGGKRFHLAENAGLSTPKDDLFMADQLVTGFANDDGLVDLFITNGAGLNPGNRGPYRLLVNRTETRNHFALLRLTGARSNRDALGAQVELRGPDGELLGYRELGVGFHRSQSSHTLHFGLGAYQGRVTARIRWPSGHVSEHEVKVDGTTSITEPSASERAEAK